MKITSQQFEDALREAFQDGIDREKDMDYKGYSDITENDTVARLTANLEV